MLLLGFVALGVAVRQLDDNGVAVASDQQEQQAAPLVPGTEPAPLVVPGAEPLANAGDTCVSISPGTTRAASWHWAFATPAARHITCL